MSFFAPSRLLGACLLGALLLSSTACHKGSGSSSAATSTNVVIKGNVTFDRIPLLRAPNGIPTGLETDPDKFEKNLPAKFIQVNLYKKKIVPDPAAPDDRSKDRVFYGLYNVSSNEDGSYYFSVPGDEEWMVEIQSTARIATIPDQAVNILADPNGTSSTLPQHRRLRYCIRKAADGTLPSSAPADNHVATSKVAVGSAPVVLDFHIGTTDRWYLATNEFDRTATGPVSGLVPSYSPGVVEGANLNGYTQAGQLESAPTGSKILSILSAFSDVARFSEAATISVVPGGPGSELDLHYLQGRSEAQGTFINFDRNSYPMGMVPDPITSVPTPTGLSSAYDPLRGGFHFFGSVRGGSANDDAWDQGLLMALAARGSTFYQVNQGVYYTQRAPLSPYQPFPTYQSQRNTEVQMALMEGLPLGLAAALQKNPYLADTTATGVTYVDVRDLTGLTTSDLGPNCPPLISALVWHIALRAKGITEPGTPTTWQDIVSPSVYPFFTLAVDSELVDVVSLFGQLKRMQASPLPGIPNSTSPFTDTVIQDLLTSLGVPPTNLPWPRPTTGALATYVTNWGDNPNSLPTAPATDPISPMALSMSQAVAYGGIYPNTSAGEMAFARFKMLTTKPYGLSVTLTGAPLVADGKVEVSFIGLGTPDGNVVETYTFTQSTTLPVPISFQAITGTSSIWLVRVRMISPTAVQPDTTVKISLVPVS